MCKALHIKDCNATLVLCDGTNVAISSIVSVTDTYIELNISGELKRFTKSEIMNWNKDSYDKYLVKCASGCCSEEEEVIEETCICTEMLYVLDEGNTANYADLLAHFNDVGSFDDTTQGATAINFVKYGNDNKSSLSVLYNGTNDPNFTGSYSHGGTTFNPISTDFSVTAVKGKVRITYSVYKCN